MTRLFTSTLSVLLLLATLAPVALAETTALQKALTEARILRGKGEDILRPVQGDQVNGNLVAAPASDLSFQLEPEFASPLLEIRNQSEANSRR